MKLLHTTPSMHRGLLVRSATQALPWQFGLLKSKMVPFPKRFCPTSMVKLPKFWLPLWQAPRVPTVIVSKDLQQSPALYSASVTVFALPPLSAPGEQPPLLEPPPPVGATMKLCQVAPSQQSALLVRSAHPRVALAVLPRVEDDAVARPEEVSPDVHHVAS